MEVSPARLEKPAVTGKESLKKPTQSFLSNFHTFVKFLVFEDWEGWFEVVEKLWEHFLINVGKSIY